MIADLAAAVMKANKYEIQEANRGFVTRFGYKSYITNILPLVKKEENVFSLLLQDINNEEIRWYLEILAFLVNKRFSNQKIGKC